MNKLPQITLAFWITKILATTLGETGSDQLAHTMGMPYEKVALIMLGVFAVSLVIQLKAKGYVPPLYWLVILSTSTAGTAMSDYMDRTLHLGYTKGSILLIVMLVSILSAWRIVEGTISVNSVKPGRPEVFYWFAILISNTLGTAFGDYLSDEGGANLGFGGSALLVAGSILAIALLGRFTKLSKVVVFWAAFVLTRPLGATVGDLLTKKHSQGGLDLGTLAASLVLLAALVGMIIFTTRQNDAPVSEAA